jgi:hypothetical protein
MLAGRQVQVALRDTDEGRLLHRLEAPLQRFPVETPTQASAATPTPEGWCVAHGVQMRQQHNARGAWYSHRLGDGPWCPGKAQQGR